MKNRKTLIAVSALSLLALGGCAQKNIDVNATGAELVPGTSNLYRFCDGSTAVYFSKMNGEDEYEFIVYDGCNPAGTPRGEAKPEDE